MHKIKHCIICIEVIVRYSRDSIHDNIYSIILNTLVYASKVNIYFWGIIEPQRRNKIFGNSGEKRIISLLFILFANI